ncbi:hypothetical protein BH10PAT1_BH10PAT1_7880 [soil metagenome]
MKYWFWSVLILLITIRFLTTRPNFVNGQLVKISGVIYQEPTSSNGNLNFSLSSFKVSSKTNSEINYGDFVVIEGEYQDGKIVKAKIDKVVVSNNIFIKLRNKLINFYEVSIPGTKGTVLSAIILGNKTDLSFNLQTKIQNKGISYLLETSGIKISILAVFLTELFILRFSRKKTILLVITIIWFYTLISGFQVTTIKASIITSIALTALLMGKLKNSLQYTFLTAFIMLFLFPNWLTDIGFILSFTATIAIILFFVPIQKLLIFLPEIIKDDFAISIAAQIGITPIVFFVFGNLNLISPFINTLIIWTITPIMILGGIAGILSFVSPSIAKLFLIPIIPLITYFISIINL